MARYRTSILNLLGGSSSGIGLEGQDFANPAAAEGNESLAGASNGGPAMESQQELGLLTYLEGTSKDFLPRLESSGLGLDQIPAWDMGLPRQ